ncbi:MAG TPA: penicillin-binding transpeptidase domain-containing protein, partial [Rhodocyclaceae bacterium]|nr:penicillin-binding transpeptidase domain-containing protein [Rhodocyclaceae bacterium]
RESPEYRKAIASGETLPQALDRLSSNAGFMARLRQEKTRLEAGFVAMDPSSGEVKAWVGSRNFAQDQFDHVAQAQRQPGSTFKPFIYAAALERGLSPDRTYYDMPMEFTQQGGKVWRPTDMSGSSGLPMTLSEGLIYSKNTITAQVIQDVGVSNVVGLARALGINQSKLDAVPSLALGTSPVTLMEMVSAYSTIADIGQYHQPVFIRRITDRDGNVLADFSSPAQRVMSEDSAIKLIDMMRGAVTRGTGQVVKTRFGIVADIAGKTGTTQNNADGWFLLMHPDLVAGAWVGFNDQRISMRSNYWGQGGHNAILLVGDFFRDALHDKLIDASLKFPRPEPPVIVADNPWSPSGGDGSNDNDINGSAEIKIIHVDDQGDATQDPARDSDGDTTARAAPTKTAADLSRMMNAMGRDPMTGAISSVR